MNIIENEIDNKILEYYNSNKKDIINNKIISVSLAVKYTKFS